MAKIATLDVEGDLSTVLLDGEVIGRIRKIKKGEFLWHSSLALEPHKEGRCKTFGMALSNLGYRVKDDAPGND
jgi:hypothetical protein